PQLGDAIANEAPVDLELAFARPAEKAVAAALALEVGPGADQAGLLIGERGKLDLETPLMRAGARTENLEDQPGTVDDLAFPGFFEVSLLHRRDRGVDDGNLDPALGDERPDALDRPPSKKSGRPERREAHHLRMNHLEIDRAR